MLNFSLEELLGVYADYNEAIWPMQFVFVFLALVIVYLSINKHKHSNTIISSSIGFLWLWIGIIFHIFFFSNLYPFAYIFGAVFIIEGILFFWAGLPGSKLSFTLRYDIFGLVGVLLILYVLIFYPIFSAILGHIYPQTSTFGLPSTTIVFTFGILLWTDKPVPKYLLIIPFFWSFYGFTSALRVGMIEDTLILVSSIAALISIILKDLKTNNRRISFSQNLK